MGEGCRFLSLKVGFLVLLAALALAPPVHSAETQTYSKIYLSPFYRPNIAANINYTYSFEINPPSGENAIKYAVITIDTWMSPTVNFQLWVDNRRCNTPNYTISTTYSGAGKAQAIFDCSNIIATAGIYAAILRSDKNGGATSAWLDLTYSEKQAASIQVHGTEYESGDLMRLFVQPKYANGTIIKNTSCFISMYAPDDLMTPVFQDARMMEAPDALYHYDYFAPKEGGVYMLSSYCYFSSAVNTGLLSRAAPLYCADSADQGCTTFEDSHTNDGDSENGLETSAGGAYRYSINHSFVFSALPEVSALRAFSYALDSYWNSQSGDNLGIYVWNDTAAAWIFLGNKTVSGTTYTTRSYTFSLSNYSGLLNGTNWVTIKIEDYNMTDTAQSTHSVDMSQAIFTFASNQTYQEIRGSGEVHVREKPLVVVPEFTYSWAVNETGDEKYKTIQMCYWHYNNQSIAQQTTILFKLPDEFHPHALLPPATPWIGTIDWNERAYVAEKVFAPYEYFSECGNFTNYYFSALNDTVASFTAECQSQLPEMLSAISNSSQLNAVEKSYAAHMYSHIWSNFQFLYGDLLSITAYGMPPDYFFALYPGIELHHSDLQSGVNAFLNIYGRALPETVNATADVNYQAVQSFIWNASQRNLTHYPDPIFNGTVYFNGTVQNNITVNVPEPVFNGTVQFNGTVAVPTPIFNGTVNVSAPIFNGTVSFNGTIQVNTTNQTVDLTGVNSELLQIRQGQTEQTDLLYWVRDGITRILAAIKKICVFGYCIG